MQTKKKIGVLTGGGDTPPLNAVLFSLQHHLSKKNCQLIGFVKGWEGVLENRWVDMESLTEYHRIGGTILKSSRVNLANLPEGFEKANRRLSEMRLSALVVIGGDDTLSNVYGIRAVPCVLVSKTIDNDVGRTTVKNGQMQILNYFTLGFPTAGEKIARFVSLEEGLRTTAYSHERIIIVESMGMQAGWLALASCFGKPDFILIPEFPLEYSLFLRKLKEVYQIQRHAIVVVAEGAKYSDGSYLYAETKESDTFGNPRFGGASVMLRDRLKKDLAGFMEVRNINAVNPSYLYRSGSPAGLDLTIGKRIGAYCAHLISKEDLAEHRFVGIQKTHSGFEPEAYSLAQFPETEKKRFPKRFVDSYFYDPERWHISPLGKEYLEPLISFRSEAGPYIRWLKECM